MNIFPPSHPLVINGVTIKRAVEIGAGDSYSSDLLSYSSHVARVDLYEPNAVLLEDLTRGAAGLDNVNVYGLAISDQSYEGSLYTLGYASYLSGALSFMRLSVEDGGDVSFWSALKQRVSVVDIRSVDHGDVDLLVLTCQGSELGILNVLRSRPVEIRVKYYCHNGKHWDYYNRITDWMAREGYQGKVLDRNEHGTFFSLSWIKTS